MYAAAAMARGDGTGERLGLPGERMAPVFNAPYVVPDPAAGGLPWGAVILRENEPAEVVRWGRVPCAVVVTGADWGLGRFGAAGGSICLQFQVLRVRKDFFCGGPDRNRNAEGGNAAAFFFQEKIPAPSHCQSAIGNR